MLVYSRFEKFNWIEDSRGKSVNVICLTILICKRKYSGYTYDERRWVKPTGSDVGRYTYSLTVLKHHICQYLWTLSTYQVRHIVYIHRNQNKYQTISRATIGGYRVGAHSKKSAVRICLKRIMHDKCTIRCFSGSNWQA